MKYILMWFVVIILLGIIIYVGSKDDNDNNDNSDDNYPRNKKHIDYEDPNKGKINVRGIWY